MKQHKDSRERAAIELIVKNPHLPLPEGQRESHENLRLKQRFSKFIAVGIYHEGGHIKYYAFAQRNNRPLKTYTSLTELIAQQTKAQQRILDKNPHLYFMGHGAAGLYGLCGDCYIETTTHTLDGTAVVTGDNHASEKFLNKNFDHLLSSVVAALTHHATPITITLESCNAGNRYSSKDGQSFLDKLTRRYPDITFSGTAPWQADDLQTGFRASGGYPTLNIPVTSIQGGIWKASNITTFQHKEVAMAAKIKPLATIESTKASKITTIDYAIERLRFSPKKAALIQAISRNTSIITISDLLRHVDLPAVKLAHNHALLAGFEHTQAVILNHDKQRHLSRIKSIVSAFESSGRAPVKGLLTILLGLRDTSIFDEKHELLARILSNHSLINQLLIESGKALIASPSNDSIIDLLVSHGADINSRDHQGRTALHYAAHSFYLYRKEPLHLIETLLAKGARPNLKDISGKTASMLAADHGHITVKRLLSQPLSLSTSTHNLWRETKLSAIDITPSVPHESNSLSK